MFQRIGIYICECGPNIKDTADIAALLETARTLENVVMAESFDFLCSPDGKKFLKEDIQAHKLSRVEIEVLLANDLLYLMGSPVHLSKTVMNLISNAVEAMHDGGKVRISKETLRHGKNRVCR